MVLFFISACSCYITFPSHWKDANSFSKKTPWTASACIFYNSLLLLQYFYLLGYEFSHLLHKSTTSQWCNSSCVCYFCLRSYLIQELFFSCKVLISCVFSVASVRSSRLNRDKPVFSWSLAGFIHVRRISEDVMPTYRLGKDVLMAVSLFFQDHKKLAQLWPCLAVSNKVNSGHFTIRRAIWHPASFWSFATRELRPSATSLWAL